MYIPGLGVPSLTILRMELNAECPVRHLYTSDAADDHVRVALGGRSIMQLKTRAPRRLTTLCARSAPHTTTYLMITYFDKHNNEF